MTIGEGIELLQCRQHMQFTKTGGESEAFALGAVDGTLLCVEALLRATGMWYEGLRGAGELVVQWGIDAGEGVGDGGKNDQGTEGSPLPEGG